MENLDAESIHVAVKPIAGGSTLRLIATVRTGDIECEHSCIVAWIERFYDYINEHRKPFCLIYIVPETVQNPEILSSFWKLFDARRDINTRYSVTTCVVATGVLSLIADVAIRMYSPNGKVYVTETLDEAKKICRQMSRETTELSEKKA
jgi:hypothetical protein